MAFPIETASHPYNSACDILCNYSVSQKNSPPPEALWQFFQNGWEFFDQILLPIMHSYLR